MELKVWAWHREGGARDKEPVCRHAHSHKDTHEPSVFLPISNRLPQAELTSQTKTVNSWKEFILATHFLNVCVLSTKGPVFSVTGHFMPASCCTDVHYLVNSHESQTSCTHRAATNRNQAVLLSFCYDQPGPVSAGPLEDCLITKPFYPHLDNSSCIQALIYSPSV